MPSVAVYMEIYEIVWHSQYNTTKGQNAMEYKIFFAARFLKEVKNSAAF